MVEKSKGKSRRSSAADISKRLPSDPTTRWARDVVDGRIVSGELVCHAAERHLRDLTDGAARGLHWAPDRAEHAFGFFPNVLTITEGAKVGAPFDLLPWHTFCVGSLFGWRKASGRMRFRSGWLETGKGQAKSPLMAAIGLYMMGYYGIQRAKVYAIGQDKATANVLFKDAAAMCRAPIPGTDPDDGDTLEARGDVIIRGILDNAFKIEHPDTNSVFQSLANGEAISGPRPTLVSADEIHEFKHDSSIETWKRAIAKMPGDALMLLGTNTPATTQIVGTSYSDLYQRVATGEILDDEAFAFIARVDKADRETVFDNEGCWEKALPALGITFPIENIRGEVNTARHLTSTAMSVKRLYFGIPLGSVDFWIAEEAWAAVQGELNLPALKKCKCWLSLDLSQKNDLTALTAVWIDGDGHLWAKTWYWTTKDGLADRATADNAPYEQWVEEGHLTAVPGAVIDKTYVAAKVAEICSEFEVQFLAFDPAGMGDFMKACEVTGLAVWLWEGPDTNQGQGLKLVSHGQGLRVLFYKELDANGQPIERLCMPRSVERLEDKILNHGITIEHSPVTYSCAANAQLIVDGQKNRAFDKKRSRGRIDGLVTIAMSTGAAVAEFGSDNSIYETRPLLVV
jgi:phage terminase large subunit-like protein